MQVSMAAMGYLFLTGVSGTTFENGVKHNYGEISSYLPVHSRSDKISSPRSREELFNLRHAQL
jgi:hypothetical protein